MLSFKNVIYNFMSFNADMAYYMYYEFQININIKPLINSNLEININKNWIKITWLLKEINLSIKSIICLFNFIPNFNNKLILEGWIKPICTWLSHQHSQIKKKKEKKWKTINSMYGRRPKPRCRYCKYRGAAIWHQLSFPLLFCL